MLEKRPQTVSEVNELYSNYGVSINNLCRRYNMSCYQMRRVLDLNHNLHLHPQASERTRFKVISPEARRII